MKANELIGKRVEVVGVDPLQGYVSGEGEAINSHITALVFETVIVKFEDGGEVRLLTSQLRIVED